MSKRNDVLQKIKDNPGMTADLISERLGFNADSHLRSLKADGMIKSKKYGNVDSHRYFIDEIDIKVDLVNQYKNISFPEEYLCMQEFKDEEIIEEGLEEYMGVKKLCDDYSGDDEKYEDLNEFGYDIDHEPDDETDEDNSSNDEGNNEDANHKVDDVSKPFGHKEFYKMRSILTKENSEADDNLHILRRKLNSLSRRKEWAEELIELCEKLYVKIGMINELRKQVEKSEQENMEIFSRVTDFLDKLKEENDEERKNN